MMRYSGSKDNVVKDIMNLQIIAEQFAKTILITITPVKSEHRLLPNPKRQCYAVLIYNLPHGAHSSTGKSIK